MPNDPKLWIVTTPTGEKRTYAATRAAALAKGKRANVPILAIRAATPADNPEHWCAMRGQRARLEPTHKRAKLTVYARPADHAKVRAYVASLYATPDLPVHADCATVRA